MLGLCSTSQFSRWPDSKKYAAALYFLSRSHVSPVNQAQWSRLNALQLQIAYGPYTEDAQLQDFAECSAKERKRREEEWKAVSSLQKHAAIRQFLDIVDNLFPNWSRTREVTNDFEADWMTQSTSLLSSSLQTHCNSTDFPTSSPHKPKPIAKETHKSAAALRSALQHLEEYDSKRAFSSSYKLPKLNAVLDSAETVSRVRRDRGREARPLQLTVRSVSGRSEAEDLWETTARSKLTDLYEAVSSGRTDKQRDTAFMQRLVAGRSSAKELALDRISSLLRTQNSQIPFNSLTFPVASSAQLESALRPILQLQCQVLSDLETVLSEDRNEPISALAGLRKVLEPAIASVFQYISKAEQGRMALERRIEQLEFELDTQSVALTAMAELYNVENWQSAAFGVTKDFRTEYQVEITRAVTVLKGPSCTAMKALEATLNALRTGLTSAEQQVIVAVGERDKLFDAIKLVRAGEEFEGQEEGKLALEREISQLKLQLNTAHSALKHSDPSEQSPLLPSPTD